MKKDINKLVRDRIPEIIEKDHKKPMYRIIEDNDEFLIKLKNKLLEEANEVVLSDNDKELVEELADLFEVIDSILKETGISISKVKEIQKEKRGSFSKKIYLYYSE